MPRDPLKYFRVEAREILEGLQRGALELERSGDAPDVVARLLRLAHTIKGAARIVRQAPIADLAHAVEDVLEPYRAGGSVERQHVDALLRLVDTMATAVDGLDAPAASVRAVPVAASPDEGGGAAPAPPPNLTAGAPPPPAGAPAPPVAPAGEPKRPPVPAAPPTTSPAAAVPSPPVLIAVKPEAARGDAHARAPEKAVDTVRVEMRELDLLLEGATEASVRLARIEHELLEIGHARRMVEALLADLAPRPGTGRLRAAATEIQELLGRIEGSASEGAEQVAREIAFVRDTARRIRLVPAGTIFDALERAARDAAHTLGKEVVFHASGGEGKLDAPVLLGLRDALGHVVRNAVAHGIESPAERTRLGKAPAGTVTVDVERRGARLAFICRDDGAGIDLERVRAAAVGRGLVTAEASASLDRDALVGLLFESGMTTTSHVDAVSGRGVGLDVVRATVERLKGEVSLAFVPGQGTTIDVCVPTTSSSITALIVEGGPFCASLPLDSIATTAFVRGSAIVRTPERRFIVDGGVSVPFLPLASLFAEGDGRDETRTAWTVAIIHAGGRRAALGLDRIIGVRDVVLRALPPFSGSVPLASGVSLDAEGQPLLCLDAASIVAAADRAAPPPKARRVMPPILVIDDSLTTRMLEKTILESAGYEVELAASAEEGIEKARASPRRFGVFLVDVEMPGMDGFTFVQTTRSDPKLGATPAILVSSRSAPEDRKRAIDSGAHAYVVKGEFDQNRLLSMIKGLLQ